MLLPFHTTTTVLAHLIAEDLETRLPHTASLRRKSRKLAIYFPTSDTERPASNYWLVLLPYVRVMPSAKPSEELLVSFQ
ncbi:hypothetical protein E2C01_095558 [Portunus trituberculatus]|uniref:Uncharacterized protein n=1 Tax=Portunus trituberculatus TaxID=210409 RepID=A0A5B7K4C8_PORTR|nr:hypothetical protein [Portunus trituberculatus]